MTQILEFLGINSILFILIVVLLIWLTILSVVFVKLLLHYTRLTQGSNKRNLRQILENVLNSLGENKTQIEELVKRCEVIEKEARTHLQKIGVVRFNPFADAGGDQSFVVALLNEHKDGVVISSLHSRSGTRIYAKPIKNGRGTKYDLSKEEVEALKQAEKED